MSKQRTDRGHRWRFRRIQERESWPACLPHSSVEFSARSSVLDKWGHQNSSYDRQWCDAAHSQVTPTPPYHIHHKRAENVVSNCNCFANRDLWRAGIHGRGRLTRSGIAAAVRANTIVPNVNNAARLDDLRLLWNFGGVRLRRIRRQKRSSEWV